MVRDFRMERAWTFLGRDGILTSENSEKRAVGRAGGQG